MHISKIHRGAGKIDIHCENPNEVDSKGHEGTVKGYGSITVFSFVVYLLKKQDIKPYFD